MTASLILLISLMAPSAADLAPGPVRMDQATGPVAHGYPHNRVAPDHDDDHALRRALEARAMAAAGEVSVVMLDLGSGARIGIGDDEVMHAASTMKVPVLVELYRQMAEGRFGLQDPVEVRATFASIVDGSPYELSAEDDGERALYRLVGREVSRQELSRRMIVRSSNLATNLLIEELGADAIQGTMNALGAGEMTVLRGVQDIPAFEKGLSNTTTARALATILAALVRCERGDVAPALRPLRPGDCAGIMDVLAAQEFTDRIPAGVPPGVRVANKTGSITAIDHDAAVVYPPGREPYVLVTLTRGIQDRGGSAALIRDLSALVWQSLAPMAPPGVTPPSELADLHRRHRIQGLELRDFDHATFWSIATPIVEAGPLRLEQVAESVEGRAINTVHYGHGPTRVLLWSQMHGDEPTATMALADIFAFLTSGPDHPLARRLADRLTVVAIPMLNPDGAQRFQRRNALGIDINRDAQVLASPEARALKDVRDRFEPHFGFNLHDQNVRTRVGRSDRQAAMALLAPPWGESRDDDDVRESAARLAGLMRLAMDSLTDGRIARYDDSYSPRAFGDAMQRWGTSTILVESGGWDGDPEKQHLRLVNFVGLLAALEAIASETYRDVSPDWYRSLPFNGPAAVDLVLRGGQVIIAGEDGGRGAPFLADVAVQYGDASRWLDPRIGDLGDLRETVARQSLEVEGLFVHLEGTGPGVLGPVDRVVARSGPEPDAPIVWIVEDGGPRPRAAPPPAGGK